MTHLTRACLSAGELPLSTYIRVHLSLSGLERCCGSVVRGTRVKQALLRLCEAKRRLGEAGEGRCLCGREVVCPACGEVWTAAVGELRGLLKELVTGGDGGEDKELIACYRQALKLPGVPDAVALTELLAPLDKALRS